ncbi:hypothetical protein, partial [Streptomyces sp. NPDC005476]|uniref:hypothetical protein n=1 Tax=Streptomyces sp. NPDC005476 TaxID=3156882 RepID=UPI003455BE50
DLGGRACSALCGGSTWQTVMNRMPSDYAEALATPPAGVSAEGLRARNSRIFSAILYEGALSILRQNAFTYVGRQFLQTLAHSFERDRAATADRLSASLRPQKVTVVGGVVISGGGQVQLTTGERARPHVVPNQAEADSAAGTSDGTAAPVAKDDFATVLIEYYSRAPTTANGNEPSCRWVMRQQASLRNASWL